jgi:mxaJ protein
MKAALWAPTAIACLLSLPLMAQTRELRVCADPGNLPYSSRDETGFENAIVALVARALDASVTYTWWSQGRGFARRTLDAGLCDVWPGVATSVVTMETTAPYYRSSYVFVSRLDANLDITSFDDPRLRTLRIGVQLIGDGSSNTPPAHALSKRGITANVRGYMVYGDGDGGPSSSVLQDVIDRSIDIALVWGPSAGYFARNSKVPLRLSRTPATDGPEWPMTFEISMGVKNGNDRLKSEIDDVLVRRRTAINEILDRFGVPR